MLAAIITTTTTTTCHCVIIATILLYFYYCDYGWALWAICWKVRYKSSSPGVPKLKGSLPFHGSCLHPPLPCQHK